MPKNTPEITDSYIILRMADADQFVDDSFKTVWVDEDKGIQEIMAKRKDGTTVEVQAYVFDKNKWTIEEARAWLREKRANHVHTAAENLGKRRTYVAAAMTLCASKPNLSVPDSVAKLTPELFNKKEMKSFLNDKYFFYVEGVHEGINANGAVFVRDELLKSYKSAGFQQIDWEHDRSQVVGFSLESELVTSPDENDPVAVAFTGILNRLSPYLQAEERVGDKVVSRDDLIRQRFFEDKLAVSMECLFDSLKCEACGYETDDYLDFEFHCMLNHRDVLESKGRVGAILVGVDFVGWGIVEFPADGEAYTSSLRTSDDGTIQDILVEASLKEKFGDLAKNVAFAKAVAYSKPTDTLVDSKKMTFASDLSKKVDELSPIPNNKHDNTLENKSNDSVGGTQMFNLTKKINAGMSLSEAMVVAQQVLRDFKGNKALDTEAQEAFASELSEALKVVVSTEDFQVSDIFTVTDEQKLAAIEVARTEEQATAQVALDELQAKYDTLDTEKTALEATIVEKDGELTTLKAAEAQKAIDVKIDAFITDVKAAGVEFADESFEKDVRSLVLAKIEDDEAITNFRGSLLASIKQSVLTDASNSSGTSATSTTTANKGDLTARLDGAAEEVANAKN